MTIQDVRLSDESKTRYLTYALSVVHSRAVPDVRDGLKPVQRRILYAMEHNLHLGPDKDHRKSAAVVGEVLARYHPHGDSACYEAMVRMAQDFSYRYPLVDGQGNFGSLDGDSAAAYRYTEAKLTRVAIEVIGDIREETVIHRPNFDQTTDEPIVLPSRVPNLLMNGASGIAVGMATAIPPHNLKELVGAITALIEDPELTDAKLLKFVKGPDFPTGCLVMNTPQELKEIYSTGKGPIRMRASHEIEKAERGKEVIVITSVPYATDKSVIVEKIADLIIQKKLPQLVDVRDESTSVVRVVLELAPGASAEKALAYLFKNTSLQMNFNVNLTALVPTENPLVAKPETLSLRSALQYFIDFRLDVTRKKLSYEKRKLEERVHLLEGLVMIFDRLNEVIEIVRKSDGRLDSAKKLQARFKLSELQALFIVDLRIYQLSRTSIDEIEAELKEKRGRLAEIERLLKSEKLLKKLISDDLERIGEQFGDPRRSKILSEVEETKIDEEEYIEEEEVYAMVTRDGWLKRARMTAAPENSRLREGDSFLVVQQCSTKDSLALLTNFGNLFVMKVFQLSPTSGFGEPVQKVFRFQDGEAIVAAFTTKGNEKAEQEILFFSRAGIGFRSIVDLYGETKKIGRRVARMADGDKLSGAIPVTSKEFILVSRDGYGVGMKVDQVPVLSGAGKGVILQKVSGGDHTAFALFVEKKDKLLVKLSKGPEKIVPLSEIDFGDRARRGSKIIQRGAPVVGVVRAGVN